MSNPKGVVVNMRYVIDAAVESKPMSESNMIPPQAKHELLGGNIPVELTDSCHNHLLDEILRRSHLEYDPERALLMGATAVG